MTEQSHRQEMNEAIRAQRERRAAPRLDVPIAPPERPEPAEEPPAEPKPRGLLGRLKKRD